MRRLVLSFLVVALGAALAVGTAGAKPTGGTPISAPVTGTFTPLGGTEPIPFAGTLTVNRFVEADAQLAVEGTIATSDPAGLFDPLTVTVTAVASPSVDQATGGCTVTVSSTSTLVLRDFALFLEGRPSMFQFGEPGEPGSDQELCRVVRATDKNPTDQNAIARALNKALGLG